MAVATKKGIQQALLAIQKDPPDLKKNATNPHFKNNYLTLEGLLDAVLPVLNKNGVTLTQTPTLEGVQTTLTHADTGEAVEGIIPYMLDRQNAQGLGSFITYGRRYGLLAILGFVADEDDDGEAASKSTKSTKSTTSTPQTGGGNVI